MKIFFSVSLFLQKCEKSVSFLLLTCVIVCTISCNDSSVKFEQPQPLNGKNLAQFPKKLIGTYIKESDSSILIISETIITEINYIPIALSMDEIKSEGGYIKDGMLYSDSADFSLKVDVRSDSVFGVLSDTSIKVDLSNKENIFRKSKRQYFINTTNDDGTWKVTKVYFSKRERVLAASRIKIVKENEDIIKAITPLIPIKNEKDSIVSVKIDPTPKELNKLIKAGMFTVTDVYIRSI